MERDLRITRSDFLKSGGVLVMAGIVTACASRQERKNDQIVREFLERRVSQEDLGKIIGEIPDGLKDRLYRFGFDTRSRPENLDVSYRIEDTGLIKEYSWNGLGQYAFFTDLGLVEALGEKSTFEKKILIYSQDVRGCISLADALPAILSSLARIRRCSQDGQKSDMFQYQRVDVFQSGFSVHLVPENDKKCTFQVLDNAVARTISCFVTGDISRWNNANSVDFVERWMEWGGIDLRHLGRLYQESDLEGFLRPTLDNLARHNILSRPLSPSEIGTAFRKIDTLIPVFIKNADQKISNGRRVEQARSEAFAMVIGLLVKDLAL